MSVGDEVVEPRALTVAEVRAKLAELPGELAVWVEGCDCSGKASDVEVCTTRRHDGTRVVEEHYVMIERWP
jgi:hypothetical protein